jgi:hypothetical protein
MSRNGETRGTRFRFLTKNNANSTKETPGL